MEEGLLSTTSTAVAPGLTVLPGERSVTRDVVAPKLSEIEIIRGQLLEVAKLYQKTGSTQRSSQDPCILVDQIMRQFEEGRDTVSFAIPYNPAFIGSHKKRDLYGLDLATRESLNNINLFCNRIAEITGRRVTFTLLYDSDLSFGICEKGIINPEDYLTGLEAIHRYITDLNAHSNGTRTQIREWDVVGDSMLGYQQTDNFLERHDLEEIYIRRLVTLKGLLTQEGMTDLKKWVNAQRVRINVIIPTDDVSMNYEWLKKTFQTDDLEFARQIAMSTTLFKVIDGEENRRNGHIIRLSPHVKTASEHSKYGFAFFPGNKSLTEPWVGNYVAKATGGFTIEPLEDECHSLEEAKRLKEEKTKRLKEEKTKAKLERRRKAREETETGNKEQRDLAVLQHTHTVVEEVAVANIVGIEVQQDGAPKVEEQSQPNPTRKDGDLYETPRPPIHTVGIAAVTSVAKGRRSCKATHIEGEEVVGEIEAQQGVMVPEVKEKKRKTPTEDGDTPTEEGDPSFVQKLKKDKEEEKRDSGTSLD